ncbi:protein TIFY 10a-like [Wolffia australiana]
MEKDFLGIGRRNASPWQEISFVGRQPDRWPLASNFIEDRSTGVDPLLRPLSSGRPMNQRHVVNMLPKLASPGFAVHPSVASAQMTIFYGGAVCVVDDVSAEKAREIMFMAVSSPAATESPRVGGGDSASGSNVSDEINAVPAARSNGHGSAIPQARKASLARFLEKRKERMAIVQPYLLTHKPVVKTSPR